MDRYPNPVKITNPQAKGTYSSWGCNAGNAIGATGIFQNGRCNLFTRIQVENRLKANETDRKFVELILLKGLCINKAIKEKGDIPPLIRSQSN